MSNADLSSEALIRHYWACALARDWAGFADCLTDDIVYRVPQTREIVRGRDGYVEFNRTYPGDWTLAIESVTAQGNQAVSRVAFTVNGETVTGISFFTLRGGRIAAIDDFWPEAYEPPARMTTAVERY